MQKNYKIYRTIIKNYKNKLNKNKGILYSLHSKSKKLYKALNKHKKNYIHLHYKIYQYMKNKLNM